MGNETYGRVAKVEPGSPAAKIGLRAGDELLSVNSRSVSDILDFEFSAAEELVMLVIRREGRRYVCYISKDAEDDLGLAFEEELFDGVRNCRNNCIFCFLCQMPKGLRPSLYVRDDDYRLSFVHGNYITLTNLADRELDRIVAQALSPLYVSVHATDPELRTRVLGRRKVDDLDRKIRKLIAGGIRIHAQVVLMPDINDGIMLEKTVRDLFGYYPGVDSVAIVPLGLSDHGPARDRYQPVTPGFCRAVIAQLRPWQSEFRAAAGRTFAYLAATHTNSRGRFSG
jgi:putative radical SAM enzyme (TIGR03279 family)